MATLSKVIRYFIMVAIFFIASQGRSHWGKGGQGDHGPPTSISEQNKVQQFQLQTSGILLLTGVQKLCRPTIFTAYATIFGQSTAAFHF